MSCTRTTPSDDDGHVDRVAVDRAVNGDSTKLTANEAKIVMWRLSIERKWGPQRIAEHVGYSKSRVSSVLAGARAR